MHHISSACSPQQCEMTHMYPTYENQGNGLHRYFDQRVPKTAPAAAQLIVLFLPGHAGHHEQARSIGSETMLAAYARDLAVDVYTLSNDESYTAFDGAILYDQIDRIEMAIATLSERYRDASTAGLYVIAHSMAGIATLEALRRIAAREAQRPALLSVDAVTFLGAPLQRPVVGCSSSLRRLHGRVRRWLSEENAVAMASEHRTVVLPAIASISGGCRDGTVPSYLSNLSGLVPPAAIALSTTTQHMPGVQTVVDHTALLWCNRLVRRVARSIVASAALRMRAESSRPSPSLPLASRVQTLRAALIGPDAHTTSPSSVAGSTTALGSEGHVQHAAIAETCDATQAQCSDVLGKLDSAAHDQLMIDPMQALLDVACVTLLLVATASAWHAWRRAQLDARKVPHVGNYVGRALPSLGRLALLFACGAVLGSAMHAASLWGGTRLERYQMTLEVSDGIDGRWGPESTMLTMWKLASPQRAALRFLVAAAPAALMHGASRFAPLSAGHDRAQLLFLTSLLLAAATHPSVGLLLAAIGAFSAHEAVCRLCLIGSAALLPGAAAWWRRPGYANAISYSSDARSALGHMCLLLIPLQLAALQRGRNRRRAPSACVASWRLGAALPIVLATFVLESWAEEMKQDDMRSSEDVLRFASVASAILCVRWDSEVVK